MTDVRSREWCALVQAVSAIWSECTKQSQEPTKESLRSVICARLIEVYKFPLKESERLYLNCLMQTNVNVSTTSTLQSGSKNEILTPCPKSTPSTPTPVVVFPTQDEPPTQVHTSPRVMPTTRVVLKSDAVPPTQIATPTQVIATIRENPQRQPHQSVLERHSDNLQQGRQQIRTEDLWAFLSVESNASKPQHPCESTLRAENGNFGHSTQTEQAMVQSLWQVLPPMIQQLRTQCDNMGQEQGGMARQSKSTQWKTRDEYVKRLQWLQRMYRQAIAEMEQQGLAVPTSNGARHLSGDNIGESGGTRLFQSSVHTTPPRQNSNPSSSTVDAVDCVFLADGNLHCKERVDTSRIPAWARKRIIPNVIRHIPTYSDMGNQHPTTIHPFAIPPTFAPILEYIKNMSTFRR